MNGHVYIAYLREFIRNGDNIYKIGKTEAIITRPTGYPKGTIFLFTSYVDDIKLAEGKIIEMLSIKTIRRFDYGKEYFEGEYKLIRDIVIKIIDDINTNSRVEFINSKMRLDNKSRNKNDYIRQENDIYGEFVDAYFKYSENDSDRIHQPDINDIGRKWFSANESFDGKFSSKCLKEEIESRFGKIKSSIIINEKTRKGWCNIKYVP